MSFNPHVPVMGMNNPSAGPTKTAGNVMAPPPMHNMHPSYTPPVTMNGNHSGPNSLNSSQQANSSQPPGINPPPSNFQYGNLAPPPNSGTQHNAQSTGAVQTVPSVNSPAMANFTNGPTSAPPPSGYSGMHQPRGRYPRQPLPNTANRPSMGNPTPGYNQQTRPSGPVYNQPPPPSGYSQTVPASGPAFDQKPQIPSGYNQQPRPRHPAQEMGKNMNQVDQTGKMLGQMSMQQQSPYGVDLMREKQIFPSVPLKRPSPPFSPEVVSKLPDPDVIHCTFNAVPASSSLQKQCKLPFGIHTHPFKEMQNLPVISNSVITRCRSCRTYINPFVSVLDHRRWQCNMCYRINDIPEELCYDQATRQYTDVRKRPELTSASVEFVAPSEYMLRPPQPSIFLFVLDVTYNAIQSGYIQEVCNLIRENIENIPGDKRCMMGFLTFHKSIHFFNLKESQPQMVVMSDIDDIYLPVPDGLLVNVAEYKDNILDLLELLPMHLQDESETLSAAGAALQVARKMVSSTGGRITLFQTGLPSIGPGKLLRRDTDEPTTVNLNPATDFYKKLALECAGEQIAVDLFLLCGQHMDLASLTSVSRHCSGCIHYYPEYHVTKNESVANKFHSDFKRYLTRPIGFEAVMRMRCTKGLSIHTFHGNFFIRSTDLLSLPNVNPDQSFSMQIEIEDTLTDVSQVCFQAALLYTSTNGERRIRIHTLALAVTSKLSDVYQYADQQAVVSLLSKMAVDRTLMSSLGDAREALMNACIDFLKVYRSEVCEQKKSTAVLCPRSLNLMPLLILALMKNDAFKLGGVKIDQRMFNLLEFKFVPFLECMLKIYPRLYSVLDLVEKANDDGENENTTPSIMQCTAEHLSRSGCYLMDTGKILYMFVGRTVSDEIVQHLFNVQNFTTLQDKLARIPELNNPLNKATRKFVKKLQKQKNLEAEFFVLKEDSRMRTTFINNLIDDRTESSMSYQEFLQHIQRQLNG